MLDGISSPMSFSGGVNMGAARSLVSDPVTVLMTIVRRIFDLAIVVIIIISDRHLFDQKIKLAKIWVSRVKVGGQSSETFSNTALPFGRLCDTCNSCAGGGIAATPPVSLGHRISTRWRDERTEARDGPQRP